MNRLLAAIRFLTICPIPGTAGTSKEDLAASLPFFPVVGLCLGVTAAVAAAALALALPGPVAAVALALLLAAVSGGLHMDGLADTADGFFSARSRERTLEIMRDSRIGPMGALALIFVILLKCAALAALATASADRILVSPLAGLLGERVESWPRLAQLLPLLTTALVMPLAGRWALTAGMAAMPYARAQGGLASVFYGAPRCMAALVATVMAVALAWGAAGRIGLIAAAAAAAVTVAFFFWCRRRIGGVTGDTLGAACELAETAYALGCAAALHLAARG